MKIKTTRILKHFFPTTLEIMEDKVIIIYHQLFSAQRIEIEIRDIYNVEVDENFWFAELIIFSRTFTDNIIKIDKLLKKEAGGFQQEINRIRKSNR